MYSNGYESLFVVDNETCLATNEVCSEVNIESNNFSPVCVLKNNRSNIIEIFVEGEYTYNSFNQKENIRVYYNLEGKVYLHSSEFVVKKDGVEKEFKNAGMEDYFTEHGLDLFPQNASGVPFTTAYFAAVGDHIADIVEDMAAEEKARAVYENLIDLSSDPDVTGPLLFLRQREIVHFQRFKELLRHYQKDKLD